MAAPTTYSFLDVNAGIVGPGAGFSLGSGAGSAEEGITIEAQEEIDRMVIGADGSGMHSLIANRAAKITVRLLKTSPINALLQAAFQFQRTSGATHGQNTITIVNKSSGDVTTAQQAAFVRQPTINYAKEGGMIEWEFNALVSDTALGAGVQN